MDINGPRIAIALVIFAAFLFIQRKQKKISDSYLERLKMGPKAEMERLAAQDELMEAAQRAGGGEDEEPGAGGGEAGHGATREAGLETAGSPGTGAARNGEGGAAGQARELESPPNGHA